MESTAKAQMTPADSDGDSSSNEERKRLIHKVFGNDLPLGVMNQIYQQYGAYSSSESTPSSAAPLSDPFEDSQEDWGAKMEDARRKFEKINEEEKASALASLDPITASLFQACFKEDEDNKNLPSYEWNVSADDNLTRHFLSKLDPHGKHPGNPAYSASKENLLESQQNPPVDPGEPTTSSISSPLQQENGRPAN